MAKYTTLKELAAAFKSGEIDRGDYFLRIDKGGAQLRLRTYTADLTEEEVDSRNEHCEELFQRPYECPVQELLRIAGIPSEYA